MHAVRFFIMKRYYLSTFVIIGALLMMSLEVMASPYAQRVVWKNRQSDQTGLYTTKSHFSNDGISIGVHALYYYGDADNMGIMLTGGFNPANIGGLVTFGYHMPISTHVIMRFSLSGGMVRSDNTEKFKALTPARDDYRSISAWFAQPAVGFEWYPINKYGFFIYAGLSFTASAINYQFYYYPTKTSPRDVVSGKTYGLLPMIQGGLGYSWNLSQSWMLSVQAMFQEGLVDSQYMNLDAFPLDKKQNDKGVALGTAGGYWYSTNANGQKQKHIHWNDGWFQLGITLTYRWSNCEQCRLLNNYSSIRTSRRSKR